MDEFPADLLAALPETSVPTVRQWWKTLDQADRLRIAGLWDRRIEVSFFAPQTDALGKTDDWEDVPAVAGGRFVPHDNSGSEEWAQGYFEYLLENPELVLAYDPEQRTLFHICTVEVAARQCVRTGSVPSNFVCPVGTATCPMLLLRGAELSDVRPRR